MFFKKIQQAEAIWFAGGNQWTYISYWRNSPISDALNQAIQERNIVIGGTSAGMAIQSKYYFSAENGTVTSAAALANPFNNQVTVDSTTFLNNAFLTQTITDTHFDSPDRKGRLVSFLARIKTDYGVYGNAIACDEYTAVCIDTNGIARVFGGAPNYDDNAYFIQSNCELIEQAPENCSIGSPLTWNLGGVALKTHQIKGDSLGSKTFDLNTWQTGTGGTWFDWSVANGVFSEQASAEINCSSLSANQSSDEFEIQVYPNPTVGNITISSENEFNVATEISVYNKLGQKVDVTIKKIENQFIADFHHLESGIYLIKIIDENGKELTKKICKN